MNYYFGVSDEEEKSDDDKLSAGIPAVAGMTASEYSNMGQKAAEAASKMDKEEFLNAFKTKNIPMLEKFKGLMSSPVGKIAGRTMGAYTAYDQGKEAIENLKKDNYLDATASGLLSASGLAAMYPPALPVSLGLAGAGLGLKGVSYLKDKASKMKDGVISSEPTDLDKKLDEEYGNYLKGQQEPSPTPTPSPEPTPEPTPSPTPEPTPEPEKSAFNMNRIMDIIGMPSAAAAEMSEMPDRKPASDKPVPKNLIRDLAYSEIIKTPIPAGFFLGVLDKESGFVPGLKNPKSSALGLGQVVEGTYGDVQKVMPSLANVPHSALSDNSSVQAIRNQIKSAIGAIMLKAKEANIPFTKEALSDPQNLFAIAKRYHGSEDDKINAEYGSDLMKRSGLYNEQIGKRRASYDEQNPEEQSKSFSDILEDVFGGMAHEGISPKEREQIRTEGTKGFWQSFGKPSKKKGEFRPFENSPDDEFEKKLFSPQSPLIDKTDEVLASSSDEGESDQEDANLAETVKRLGLGSQLKPEDLFALKSALMGESEANVAKGMALMASGIIGAGPKKSFVTVPKLEGIENFDALGKQGKTQLEANEVMYKLLSRSPASEKSRRLQDYYIDTRQKRGKSVNEKTIRGLSADELSELIKLEDKYTTQFLNQDAKHAKRASELNKALTEELAAPRTVFGKAASIKRSAEAIEVMANRFKNKNNLTKQEIYELAKSLDSMLAQGAATVAGTGKLIPEGLGADLNSIYGYMMNIPVGTDQAKFVKRMLSTVAAEKRKAMEQIKETKGKTLSGFLDVKMNTPDSWHQILRSQGLDDDEDAAPSSKKPMPGDILTLRDGRRVRVLADGESYEEI